MRVLQVYKVPEKDDENVDVLIYSIEEAQELMKDLLYQPKVSWVVEAVEMSEEEYSNLQES